MWGKAATPSGAASVTSISARPLKTVTKGKALSTSAADNPRSVDVKLPENHARGGNSEVRWLDNLLYLYTRPCDIVVDTFASGETVS
jgi:hypothetical protein